MARHCDSPECKRCSRLDMVCAGLAIACAIHCLLIPVFLPVVALFVGNIYVELSLLGMALIFGGVALVHGYRIHHKRWPAIIFLIGFSSLIFGNWIITGGHPVCCTIAEHNHEASSASIYFISLGGFLLVSAHLTNFLIQRKLAKSNP
jgi:hypothetical protein